MGETDRISCEEAELYASMACDGELDEARLKRLRAHLADCDACRRMIAGLAAVNDLVAMRVAAKHSPVAPNVEKKDAKVVSIREFIKPLAYIAAALLIFIGGRYYGVAETEKQYADFDNLNPAYVVTTPTMWLESHDDGSYNANLLSSAFLAEKPFTDSIKRYRAVIVDALSAEDVNWMEIRRLVEAMGELRTDIELLTLHMAYLDIRTGTSGKEVAAHWQRIGESFQGGRARGDRP